MAVVVLTSAAGSPGVTTLGIGLALTWPRAVLLADCDPGAHQAVLAGYFLGQSANGKGLLRVAEAHRDRRPLAEVVMDQTLPLTEEADHSRLFLPGFSKPGSASLFAPVWTDLVETFVGFGTAEIDVIVDAGRIGQLGLPQPLLEKADEVCIVTRTTLRSVASARLHSTTLVDQGRMSGTDGILGLILVGEGRPYSGREISALLGLPVVTTIADDAGSAACFSDGARRPRKFDSAPLARSLHGASTDINKRLRRSSEQVGSRA